MRCLLLVVLLPFLLFSGACSSDGDADGIGDPSDTVSFSVGDPQPDPVPVPQAINGLTDRTWKLVELGGKPAAFPDATLRIEGRRAFGSSGCNRIDGTINRSATALTFRDLAMTERGCEPFAIHAFENAVATALGGVRRWEIRGTQLVLTGNADTLVFDPPN